MLALTLYATPATGSVICGMAKIWRKAWISSASRMSRNWRAAVLHHGRSAPLALVSVVGVIAAR